VSKLFYKVALSARLNNNVQYYLGIKAAPPSFDTVVFPRQNVRLHRHFTHDAGNAVEGKPDFTAAR